MSGLDDMTVVDEHGQCVVCGRFIGDDDHECPAPGSLDCVLAKALEDAIMHGPIEAARAVLAANDGPDEPYDGDVPF